EELLLRAAAVDLLDSAFLLDRLDLRLAIRAQVPVELAKAHDVHEVDVPGERGLLQAAELEGAPHLEFEALDVPATGEGGDGQDVADLEPVELQERGEVPVEHLVALVEVGVVGVEEGVEELVQVLLRGAERTLEQGDGL